MSVSRVQRAFLYLQADTLENWRALGEHQVVDGSQLSPPIDQDPDAEGVQDATIVELPPYRADSPWVLILLASSTPEGLPRQAVKLEDNLFGEVSLQGAIGPGDTQISISAPLLPNDFKHFLRVDQEDMLILGIGPSSPPDGTYTATVLRNILRQGAAAHADSAPVVPRYLRQGYALVELSEDRPQPPAPIVESSAGAADFVIFQLEWPPDAVTGEAREQFIRDHRDFEAFWKEGADFTEPVVGAGPGEADGSSKRGNSNTVFLNLDKAATDYYVRFRAVPHAGPPSDLSSPASVVKELGSARPSPFPPLFAYLAPLGGLQMLGELRINSPDGQPLFANVAEWEMELRQGSSPTADDVPSDPLVEGASEQTATPVRWIFGNVAGGLAPELDYWLRIRAYSAGPELSRFDSGWILSGVVLLSQQYSTTDTDVPSGIGISQDNRVLNGFIAAKISAFASVNAASIFRGEVQFREKVAGDFDPATGFGSPASTFEVTHPMLATAFLQAAKNWEFTLAFENLFGLSDYTSPSDVTEPDPDTQAPYWGGSITPTSNKAVSWAGLNLLAGNFSLALGDGSAVLAASSRIFLYAQAGSSTLLNTADPTDLAQPDRYFVAQVLTYADGSGRVADVISQFGKSVLSADPASQQPEFLEFTHSGVGAVWDSPSGGSPPGQVAIQAVLAAFWDNQVIPGSAIGWSIGGTTVDLANAVAPLNKAGRESAGSVVVAMYRQ